MTERELLVKGWNTMVSKASSFQIIDRLTRAAKACRKRWLQSSVSIVNMFRTIYINTVCI